MILCHKKILYLIGSFMDWIGRSLLGNEGKVNNSTSNILKEANIIINIIHSIIKIIKKPPEFHNVADMNHEEKKLSVWPIQSDLI